MIECESTVLHITDCHLFEDTSVVKNGVNPFASLGAVLTAAYETHSPDIVVATGDIAHDPTPATYRLFFDLVRSFHEGPFVVSPGNHDIWESMQPLFELQPMKFGSWTMVPLDTHVEGRVSGEVAEQTLLWFQRCLERANGHIIVVGHHPLVDIGVAWLDEHQVQNSSEVLSMLQMHPSVQAYICGHVHLESLKQYGQLKLWTTPSTCWQFANDQDTFALSPLTPGWRWLELYQDGMIDTRVERLNSNQVTGVK